jgi:hypothetical protein
VKAEFGNVDALIYKGVQDCSANPDYPAADAGHVYKCSVAGKIGGASGVDVTVGDLIICDTDSTSTGNDATVGSKWSVVQGDLSIIDNLTSTSTINALSANQGKVLKALADTKLTGTGSFAITASSVTDGTTTFDKYTHPTSAGNKHIPTGGSSGEFLKYDSSGTAVWADDNDTVYTHPTGAGNKHIPSGGASGNFLKYSSSGTAVWADDNNTEYSVFTGASSGGDGTTGLAPQPDAGEEEYFLRGDSTWQEVAGTITALNNQAENRLVTIGSTTTQLDGEASLVFDGTKLGIGTTEPSSALTVHSGAAAVSAKVITTAATGYFQMDNAGGAAGLISNGDELGFFTSASGTERLRIDSDGRIHVNKYLQYLQTDGSTVAGYVGNANAVSGRTTSDFAISSAASGSSIEFQTNGEATPKMVLDSSGNVGIGGTPTAKLDVLAVGGGSNNFGDNTSLGLQVTGAGHNRIKLDTSSTSGHKVAYQLEAGATSAAITLSQGDGDMELSTGGTERLRIESDGAIKLAQMSAPGTTTDRLYNTGGTLYWNGTDLTTGGSGGAGHTIQDEGDDLATAGDLNFVGELVTATAESGASQVTIDAKSLWLYAA